MLMALVYAYDDYGQGLQQFVVQLSVGLALTSVMPRGHPGDSRSPKLGDQRSAEGGVVGG
jgi:hypothetical protein